MLLYINPPNAPPSLARPWPRASAGKPTAHALVAAGWLGSPPSSPRAPWPITPPHPADHGQLDDENDQRRPHHRADGRWDDLRLDVDGVPRREPSPVATLAREPVPDREGDRQELSGHERRARACAKWPLEDDRPFSLVVARDTGEIPRVVRRDGRASPAGELKGIGARQIEEPEIHGVLARRQR